MIRFLQTPSPTKKIVLGGLLTVICVMMVVTLIPGGSLFGGGTVTNDTDIAKVDGDAITVTEVSKAAQNMAQRNRYPMQLVPYLMPQAADMVIKEHALIAEANRMGLKVSDEELRQVLHKGQFGEILFPKGQYVGDDGYQNFVQSQFSLTVPEFEKELKQQIELQKLQNVVVAGVTTSDKDVENLVRQQKTKVKFDYASISLQDVEKGINPSDAELKAFYEAHKEQYKDSIPEKRKVKFVMINGGKLPGVEPSDNDVQAYYNAHKAEYQVAETIKDRHILIKTPEPGPDGKVDQKAVDAAKAKAEDILKQAKSGADFAALAKKYSDDPGSKDQGGYFEFTKGKTVPEFEQAAFAAKVGEIVGPVRSPQYGFFIIKVEGHEPAHTKPLEEVKPQIVANLSRQKAQDAAQKAANQLRDAARAQGLDKAAAAAGDQVQTTDFIKQSDSLPGVGMQPQFMNAVFHHNAKSGADTAPVSMGYVVYEVTDVQPPSTPTFEEAKAQVETAFKANKAQTLLVQKAQELADKARADHDLKKAAKDAGATVKTSELVTEGDQVPDVGSMSGQAAAIFGAKPGEIVGPVQGGRNAIVMALLEKQEPSADDIKSGMETARQQLLNKKRDEMLEVYVSNLVSNMEKNGKIKRNPKALQRLSQTQSQGE
ncbi:MAG TPA: peptidyl-prolyl cis-trans isomerase [Candidatus Koribacter sp.]|jgi:peptidyl-prolyl cis-trans isomerase D